MPENDTLRLKPEYADTPAFKAAVDAAVKAQLDALLPALINQVSALKQGTEPTNVEQGVLQGLALQLAELTGQGTGRVYVAPEIIEKRRMALGKLKETILDLWKRSNGGRNSEYVPAYRLTSKVYLNLGMPLGEVLIDPLYRDNQKLVQATEIDWPGIPNPAMAPINEAADQVYALFCEWTGIAGPSAPDELYALNSHGAVVRGKAASVILRGGQSNGLRGEHLAGDPMPGDDGLEMPAASIRRHDREPKQLVQVLGRLTKPIEVS